MNLVNSSSPVSWLTMVVLTVLVLLSHHVTVGQSGHPTTGNNNNNNNHYFNDQQQMNNNNNKLNAILGKSKSPVTWRYKKYSYSWAYDICWSIRYSSGKVWKELDQGSCSSSFISWPQVQMRLLSSFLK